MAAGLHSLDHQRIDARADKLFGERQRRREADDLGARSLDRLEAAFGRQTARKHDMADAMFRAPVDQLAYLRVHRDQVAAEIARCQRLGPRDFDRKRTSLNSSPYCASR